MRTSIAYLTAYHHTITHRICMKHCAKQASHRLLDLPISVDTSADTD